MAGPSSSAAKRPAREAKLRCWKCYQWFVKEELRGHNCLPKLLGNKVSYFCCYFCGFCCADSSAATRHVQRCRQFKLQPMPDLLSKRNSSPHSESESAAAAAEDSTCAKCQIAFADADELRLHSSKARCRSIECNVCKKMFATSLRHQVYTRLDPVWFITNF